MQSIQSKLQIHGKNTNGMEISQCAYGDEVFVK